MNINLDFKKISPPNWQYQQLSPIIIASFENKEYAHCIFLDFAKAFDTVNHKILLQKLEYYGIRGNRLKWFDSYLTDRQQYTEVNNILSDVDYIKCGVPQGSVLGPLLFLLYIDDISESSNLLKYFLFADDTTIFYSSKNAEENEKILNTEIDKVSEWLSANKLSLNVRQSKLLTFTLRAGLGNSLFLVSNMKNIGLVGR